MTTPADRADRGKAARKRVPRTAHATSRSVTPTRPSPTTRPSPALSRRGWCRRRGRPEAGETGDAGEARGGRPAVPLRQGDRQPYPPAGRARTPPAGRSAPRASGRSGPASARWSRSSSCRCPPAPSRQWGRATSRSAGPHEVSTQSTTPDTRSSSPAPVNRTFPGRKSRCRKRPSYGGGSRRSTSTPFPQRTLRGAHVLRRRPRLVRPGTLLGVDRVDPDQLGRQQVKAAVQILLVDPTRPGSRVVNRQGWSQCSAVASSASGVAAGMPSRSASRARTDASRVSRPGAWRRKNGFSPTAGGSRRS